MEGGYGSVSVMVAQMGEVGAVRCEDDSSDECLWGVDTGRVGCPAAAEKALRALWQGAG